MSDAYDPPRITVVGNMNDLLEEICVHTDERDEMGKKDKPDHYVNVVDIETRRVLKQHGPFGSRKFADRAEVGIQRSTDPNTTFTHVTTTKEGSPT